MKLNIESKKGKFNSLSTASGIFLILFEPARVALFFVVGVPRFRYQLD